MESVINTYRLNQGNKEYILTIRTMGEKIRITCKNALNENINFSRDFTIDELRRLDQIFISINTAYDALNYIDKALKEQKVGVSEEGETIKINFYVKNEGSLHNLQMTLGEGTGFSSTNQTEIVETTTTTTNTASSYGVNNNDIYGTTTTTTTENLDNLLSQLNLDQNQYIDTTNTQYLTSVDNTADYLQNIQLDSDINQYTNAYDTTAQYTTGYEDLMTQYTTGATDYNTNYYDTTAQYNTYDTTAQYNTYDTTAYNNNDYLNTFTNTQTVETKEYVQPEQNYESQPLVTPVEENQNINSYETTITTTKTTNVNTQNVGGDDRLNRLVGDTNSLKSEHQLIQDKLNLLSGVVNEYKTKLELMEKEKAANEVNALRAENRAIKQQLSELNNLRNDAAEVRVLRSQLAELDPLRKKAAQMDALKGQLNELNTLRAKVAELNAVKAQLGELNSLRAQVGQMNVLKQQLAELNALKAKLAELNGVRAQLGELNNLKAQVTQITYLKKQISELSNLKDNAIDAEKLRKKIAELEAIKLQYEEEIKRLRQSQIEETKLLEFSKTESRMRSGMESKQLLFEDKAQQICVKGDIIHNTDELELLTRKINKLNQKITLNLLYKASADSDKASAFHAKCDDARSTLVLVETDKGRRFGGYTTCSWAGECIEKKDEDAFVFSLDKMMIYENIPGEDAIGCYPKFGPIFLGCQIRIYDNAFTKGGTTFEKGLNFNTEEDYELTGGDREFNVRDIEVYEVIPQ